MLNKKAGDRTSVPPVGIRTDRINKKVKDGFVEWARSPTGGGTACRAPTEEPTKSIKKPLERGVLKRAIGFEPTSVSLEG